jgi:hypothetical protein
MGAILGRATRLADGERAAADWTARAVVRFRLIYADFAGRFSSYLT